MQSGQVATLDGSGSVDPDAAPAALTFSWSFVAKPVGSLLTDTDIADAQADAPSFVPDVQGAYVMRLKVDDGAATDEENVVVHADDTPPQIVIVPADGSTVNTTTPTIAVSYDDGLGSGLDLSSFHASLNGVDVTASTLVGSNGATHTPAAPLPFGENTAIARISDRAGNEGIAVSNFIVNTPPEIVTDPLTVAMVGELYEHDVDATDANGDPLTYSLTVSPESMAIDDTTGLVSWTPAVAGLVDVTVKVEDTRGGMALQAFQIDVADIPNGPPVLDPIGDRTVDLGSSLTIQLAATDPDGDPLTFLAQPMPLPENASLNGVTGEFTLTPSESQIGEIALTFFVGDGMLTDSESIIITVMEAPLGTPTSLVGRLLDTNDFVLGVETPIVGATVSLLDTWVSTSSNAVSEFTLTNLPSGSQVLGY